MIFLHYGMSMEVPCDPSSSKQNQEEIELHTVPTMMIMIGMIMIIVIDCIRMVDYNIH